MYLRGMIFCALAAVAPAASAGHRLYVCGATSKDYVLGQRLPPSGLFARAEGGRWERMGFVHPYVVTVDYDTRDPRVLYLAAGNGCIRSNDRGRTWVFTTGWEMTELQDVSVDRNAPDQVWVALPDGIGFSPDGGRSWERRQAGLAAPYTQAIRVDRTQAGRVLAGTERGVFATRDNGRSWSPVALEAPMVTSLEQSPHDHRHWIATTQSSGVWESRDGGVRWGPLGGIDRRHTWYNVAFDPARAGRVALSGWGAGVALSNDSGQSWSDVSRGLPSREVWRVRFDPDRPGRLLAGIHEQALYEWEGEKWENVGLEGWLFLDLVFVPESGGER